MSLYDFLPVSKDGSKDGGKEAKGTKKPAFKPAFSFKAPAPRKQFMPPPAVKRQPPPPVPRVLGVPRTVGVPRAVATKKSSPTMPAPKKKNIAPAPVFATLSNEPSVIEEVVKACDVQDQPFHVDVHNQYDPARPNDYEEYCMERDKKRKDADRRERNNRDDRGRSEAKPEEIKTRVIQPPAKKKIDLKISADDMFARRQAMSKPKMKPPSSSLPPPGPQNGFRPPAPKASLGGMGMAPPPPKMAGPGAGPGGKPGDKAKKSTPPSRCVMLRNVVGRGEVDDDLQGEIAGECQKYGNVLRCKVHEMGPTAPDSEAGRIFVQFSTITSATKAFKAMEGRFFGGRIVKAGHYSEEKFHKDQLAD